MKYNITFTCDDFYLLKLSVAGEPILPSLEVYVINYIIMGKFT